MAHVQALYLLDSFPSKMYFEIMSIDYMKGEHWHIFYKTKE